MSSIDQLCNQSANSPIDSTNQFNQYFSNLKNITNWDNVGILTDEGNRNTIIILSLNNEVISSIRLSLNPIDTAKSLLSLSNGIDFITYRCIQGYELSKRDLISIESISHIWNISENQSTELKKDEIEPLFDRLDNNRREKGRGATFSKDTKNTVWRESFGRCMYTGCGERLDFDNLSGTTGNYAYLAHNVASSEQGARGITELSKKLSDDPSNVLLLCDKHHRLIDKIAAVDYPASSLSSMKKEFSLVANNLLDGLMYQPIPVYAVLWPVNSQTVSPPSYLQVSASLSKIKRRIHEQINILSDNEDLLINSPDLLWQAMPDLIKNAADKIIQQTKGFDYNAALFGFGPSSALIGLGAKLGNKNSIIPMLRFREGGTWSWPKGAPVGEFYEIQGLDVLKNGSDFVINISLTSEPESLVKSSEAICNKKNAQIITIKAKEKFMGNGAIPHPEDGKSFAAMLQSIYHKLSSDFGAKCIHLFVCASNAASIFIGQAYDTHHPDLIIYDFDSGLMVPRLQLTNDKHTTQLIAI